MSAPGKLTMQDLQNFAEICARPRQPIEWEWVFGSVADRSRVLQILGLPDSDSTTLYGHPLVVDPRMPAGYVDLRPKGAGERL